MSEETKVTAVTEQVTPKSADGTDVPPSPTTEKEHVAALAAPTDGINLIPRPSSDPRDPLNWSFTRKCLVAGVIYVVLFTGFSAPFNGQVQIAQQAALYHKTTVQITYFNSAASGGLAASCWFWYPLSKKFGRSAVTLWTGFGLLATQIWALYMRGADQYDAFLAAKFFMGFFGQVMSFFGPLYLVDMFFLHQRGRAFNILGIAMNLGASAGPSFSGFITDKLPWYDEYYWTIGLCALSIILIFCFLEETGWERTPEAENVIAEGNWMQRRIKTFVPGTAVVKKPTGSEIVESFVTPLKIAVSPVLLLAAGFDATTFGFWVALNALSPIWLQKPVVAGGYGFSVLENAGYTMVHWINLIVCQVYGQYLADRIPLWLCARNGGKWKPEFRLHALWIPNFILTPIGFGLVGAALQYHTHWIVMAIGNFLVTFGAMQGIPVTMNYISECFRKNTVEAVIPLNSMRLFLGLTINFFINPWVSAVGIGWVYGMMAFFCLGSFGFVIVLMYKGHELREASPWHTTQTEEGEKVLADSASTQASA